MSTSATASTQRAVASGRPIARAIRARQLVMVQHGYNTTFDGQGNQLYAVNGIPFCYMDSPVRVRRGEVVRIYLVKGLEYDPINSFHLHGNFFDYYPTGTRLEPAEFTDTVMQAQGQRGICEVRFLNPGRFMFHAHKTEFTDLGWMGMFEVDEEETPGPAPTAADRSRLAYRCGSWPSSFTSA